MKYIRLCTALLLSAVGCIATTDGENTVKTNDIFSIEVEQIQGDKIPMSTYKGKVLLIVNTASKCGFTEQYAGLEKLYKTHKDSGLVILGFPSNDFMRQEPGSNEEIASFCQLNYGVTFPMFAKIKVKKGKEQHPLYQLLTTDPDHGKKISWNFNKFLVGRDGEILAHYGSRVKPDDEKLLQAVTEALKPK